MSNPFDQLDGYEMAGLFSKLKKGIKKVGRPFEKVHRFARDKMLPKKVGAALKKLEKNPIVRAAAIAVVSVVATPAVGAVLAKAGIATNLAGQAVNAKSIAMAAGKGALKSVVKQKIVKRMSAQQKTALRNKATNIVTPTAAKSANVIVDRATSDPAMITAVRSMVAKGMTPVQIANTWKKSDAFIATSTSTAATAIYPQVLSQVIAAGVPKADAQAVAKDMSNGIALSAAENVAGKNDYIKVIAVAAPLAFAFFGG